MRLASRGISLTAPVAAPCRGKAGAGERTRTADLLITNQLLYQLSYAGFGFTEGRAQSFLRATTFNASTEAASTRAAATPSSRAPLPVSAAGP